MGRGQIELLSWCLPEVMEETEIDLSSSWYARQKSNWAPPNTNIGHTLYSKQVINYLTVLYLFRPYHSVYCILTGWLLLLWRRYFNFDDYIVSSGTVHCLSVDHELDVVRKLILSRLTNKPVSFPQIRTTFILENSLRVSGPDILRPPTLLFYARSLSLTLWRTNINFPKLNSSFDLNNPSGQWCAAAGSHQTSRLGPN
jgi:hypothetical protein